MIKKIDNFSLDYQMDLFSENNEELVSAVGGFRHVFVDGSNGKSRSISVS